MINLGIMLFFAATLNFELCFSTCAHAEYEINRECCPMCVPGNHVYWHCTVDTSTACVPCPASTYIDEPNGLNKCFPCSMCDADTICEPLEGFYCIEQKKDSCRFAVKHSECHPGQYVKKTGTAFSDTFCGNCTVGTYSNGSFTACLPYSNCEIRGLTEIKPGTMSSDVECGKSLQISMVVGVIIGVIVAVVLATAFGIWRLPLGFNCKLKQKRQASDISINYCKVPIQESDRHCEPKLDPSTVTESPATSTSPTTPASYTHSQSPDY